MHTRAVSRRTFPHACAHLLLLLLPAAQWLSLLPELMTGRARVELWRGT